MRKILIIFAMCCAPLMLSAADVDDGDVARAGRRTGVVSASPTTATSATRPGATRSNATNVSGTSAGASRGTSTVSRTATTTATRDRTVVNPRGIGGTRDNLDNRSTTSRSAVVPSQSSTRSAVSTASRTMPGNPSRTAAGVTRAATTTTARGVNRGMPSVRSARSAVSTSSRTDARSAISGRVVRSATAMDIIGGTDYQQCRTVFYDCMDEFCANKDTQLKRCACSSRLHDFDGAKQQLAAAEEKMLDFSQRLLTVNMDKEDAAAIGTATEGELAFQQQDTSESKKLLDEIADKLKSTSSSNNQNMSSLSWTLNMDAAFDNLDATLGASTTTKEGTALYNAALPVCRDMASEVCDSESLALAESGYQMSIEQDCNTVAKAYDAQFDAARNKVRESGALLDMSRLNIYNDRNSDDILTCKKKMLDLLSSSSVCGDDLGRCLDTTGQYIDPATGQPFLTEQLADLANVITAPTGDETWASLNEPFVTYLNSKKKYIEPAMEHCQDIADQVWDAFVEDALAQIKLAQTDKLEQMRQGCTELTAQCASNTAKSISDFDARSLSIFGVWADKTVNEMCSSVRTACVALLGKDGDWDTGVSEIVKDTTYDTIIKTCREVGKNCIIQSCKSVSGNFGLCDNIQTSVNRKAILNGTACWDDVYKCVEAAGGDKIVEITDRIFETSRFATPGTTADDFYKYVSNGTDAGNSSWYELMYDVGSDCDGGACHAKVLNQKIGSNSKIAYIYHKEYKCKSEAGVAWCSQQDITNGSKTYEFESNSVSNLKIYNTVVFDKCEEKCKNLGAAPACRICRLTEQIWGNCERNPETSLTSKLMFNQIKKPKAGMDTLLYWFAQNTGTTNVSDSCLAADCPVGFEMINGVCYNAQELSSLEKLPCPKSQRIEVGLRDERTLENCCYTSRDKTGNCCLNNVVDVLDISARFGTTGTASLGNVCSPISSESVTIVAKWSDNGKDTYLICVGTLDSAPGEGVDNYPNGKEVKCNGRYVQVSKGNNYRYSQTTGNLKQLYNCAQNNAGTNLTCPNNCDDSSCTLSTDKQKRKVGW